MKTLVQCDFDGTITDGDVSFLILEAFAQGDWRKLLEEYRQGRIAVGRFNTEAFAMVKTDEATLVSFVRRETKIRPGFSELVHCCHQKGFEFVIVSNGLDFYINTILRGIGLNDIKVFAAQTHFAPTGLEVRYIGPDGKELQEAFKESYVGLFLQQGYRIIYIGDGLSDVAPARLAHQILARGDLLRLCQEMNLKHTPFNDLNDIVKSFGCYAAGKST